MENILSIILKVTLSLSRDSRDISLCALNTQKYRLSQICANHIISMLVSIYIPRLFNLH